MLEENIIKIYNLCTLEDVELGRAWYSEAAQFASSLSEKYNVNKVVAAGVCSSLSVMKSWDQNKKITDLYFQGIKNTHTSMQIRKCELIEEKKSYISTISILGGLKTRNFFKCIIDPTDPKCVVNDRHGISIAVGYSKYTCTNKEYKAISEAYLNVAKDLGIIGSQLQSMTWLCYRRLKKLKLLNYDKS